MMSKMIVAFIVCMKMCSKKHVNYDKMSGVIQGKQKNATVFHSQLVHVFHKYTNIDPSSREGEALLGHHFIYQSVPDIHYKLQNFQIGPQTPMIQLLDMMFSVFISQDSEECF